MKEQLKLCEGIARKAHKGQMRRDGKTPYIKHVEKVVSLVDDEDLQCVAWLHDVIEDTDYTAQHLSDAGVDQFIVWIVGQILTHRKDMPYLLYIEAIKGSEAAKKVKIADIVANLSDSPTSRQVVKYHRALFILCK